MTIGNDASVITNNSSLHPVKARLASKHDMGVSRHQEIHSRIAGLVVRNLNKTLVVTCHNQPSQRFSVDFPTIFWERTGLTLNLAHPHLPRLAPARATHGIARPPDGALKAIGGLL